MASIINTSGLILNPEEVRLVSEFVMANFLEMPDLNLLHNVNSGVAIKEQIIIANALRLSGIASTSCARVSSGGQATLTQKYWEPKDIADTFINCQKDLDKLFKAYYGQVKAYRALYDFTEGVSDFAVFVSAWVLDSMRKAVLRYAWLGDTTVSTATGGAAGLLSAGNAQFYNVITGVWKQVFGAVGLPLVAISENALATKALQTTLAADRAMTLMEAVVGKANATLRGDKTAKIYLTGRLFQNYKNSLRKAGTALDVTVLENGIAVTKYDGYDVINTETFVDVNLEADFAATNANNAYYLPNRILFTSPNNIPLGTLEEASMSNIESFWDQVSRQNYSAYGFTLDTVLIDPSVAVAAY